jgi:hypothetical protein
MRPDACASYRNAVATAKKRAEAARAAHRNAVNEYGDERRRVKADISTEIADLRSYEEGNEKRSDDIFARQKAIADVLVDTTPTVTVNTDPPRTLPRSQGTIDLLSAEIETLKADKTSNETIIAKKLDFIVRQRQKRNDMDLYPEKYVDPSLRENRKKAEEALEKAQEELDACISRNP